LQVNIKIKLAIFKLFNYLQFTNLETKGNTMSPQFISSLDAIKEKLSHLANPGFVLKSWFAKELISQEQYQALLPYYFASKPRFNR
jgi:hypothetical protein